jgi:hypothetical protein
LLYESPSLLALAVIEVKKADARSRHHARAEHEACQRDGTAVEGSFNLASARTPHGAAV